MSAKNVQQLGTKIRQMREKHGMSLTDLSRESNVSRGYLHLIEKGESSPTQDKLTAIANALGVLVGELVGELESSDVLSHIPESLRQFAEENGLPTTDVIMLSKINYRGRQPQNATEWKVLYAVIKGTLSE